jgi:pimeloyl-ACP methyl ester carboxylesterase
MFFITDDGVKLFYLDQGRGPPVLLLHAFPLTSDSFRPQIAALSSRWRFLVPDHRGFGQSEGTSGKTEMSRLAQDAFGLLDSLNIQRAVVGGVSMGGYAALALLQHDPGRVKGLVLVDTQAIADDEVGKQRREETARAVLEKGIGVLVDTMLPRLLSSNASLTVRKEVERMIRANLPEGAAAALRGMALRPDSKDILARFAGPALVVVGEQDAITPLARAEEMRQLLSSAELVKIAGAGHLSNLESPEQFNRALEKFLTGRFAG